MRTYQKTHEGKPYHRIFQIDLETNRHTQRTHYHLRSDATEWVFLLLPMAPPIAVNFAWRLERTRLELHNKTIEILSPTKSGHCTNNNETPPNRTSNLPCATDNHIFSRPSFLWWNRRAGSRHWRHPGGDLKNKNMFNVSHIDWICEPTTCAPTIQHPTSRITWCRDGVPVHPAVALSKLSGKYMSTRRTPKHYTHHSSQRGSGLSVPSAPNFHTPCSVQVSKKHCIIGTCSFATQIHK